MGRLTILPLATVLILGSCSTCRDRTEPDSGADRGVVLPPDEPIELPRIAAPDFPRVNATVALGQGSIYIQGDEVGPLPLMVEEESKEDQMRAAAVVEEQLAAALVPFVTRESLHRASDRPYRVAVALDRQIPSGLVDGLVKAASDAGLRELLFLTADPERQSVEPAGVIPVTVTSERTLGEEGEEEPPPGCQVAQLYRAQWPGPRCGGAYWGEGCLGFFVQADRACDAADRGGLRTQLWRAALIEDGLVVLAPDGEVLDLIDVEELAEEVAERSGEGQVPVLILSRDPELPYSDELALRAELAGAQSFVAVLSAATMVWGRPEPPGPPPRVVLPPALIRRYVADHLAMLRCCYGRGLGQDGELSGDVTLRFTVGEDGEVSDATSYKSTLDHDDVETCLTNVFRAMRFPLPEAVITYHDSLRLEPCGEDDVDELEPGAPPVPQADQGTGLQLCARPEDFTSRCASHLDEELRPAEARRALAREAARSASAIIGPGSLSREAIRARILRHMDRIRSCYERARLRRPELEGRMTLRFTVSPAGYVDTLNLESSELNAPEVEECVMGEVRRIHFPPPAGGGVVEVTYPFRFQLAGEPPGRP